MLSSSQSPVFWPRILQPSEQAESPKKHRKPASETYAKLKVTKKMANFLILNDEDNLFEAIDQLRTYVIVTKRDSQ